MSAMYPLQQDSSAAFERLLLGEAGTSDKLNTAVGYSHYLHILAQSRPYAQQSLHDPSWQQWASQILQAFDEFRLLRALRKGEFGVEGLNERVAQLLCAKATDQQQILNAGNQGRSSIGHAQ